MNKILSISQFLNNQYFLGYTEKGDLCLAFNYGGQEYSEGHCRYDYHYKKSWCGIGNLKWGWCDETSDCIHGNHK